MAGDEKGAFFTKNIKKEIRELIVFTLGNFGNVDDEVVWLTLARVMILASREVDVFSERRNELFAHPALFPLGLPCPSPGSQPASHDDSNVRSSSAH